MATVIPIYLENVTDSGTIVVNGVTYDSIRLYSSLEPAGTFTVVTTATLVASQEQYELDDPLGDSSYYYRYTLFSSSTLAESGYSETSPTLGTQLRRLRFHAAAQANAASRGTCSAAGGSLAVIDLALIDEGRDDDYAAGLWAYRPDASDADDRCRRISSFSQTTGELGILRSWTPPAAGENYELYSLLPPVRMPGQAYSWSEAVRDGLNCILYQDELNLGRGDNSQTRFDLSPFLHDIQRKSLDRVWLRTTDSNGYIYDRDAGKNLGYWRTRQNGPESLTLVLGEPPTTDETIWTAVNRKYHPLYNDTDVTQCPFELAWRATLYAAYRHINRARSGKYAFEVADALDALKKQLPEHYPAHSLVFA